MRHSKKRDATDSKALDVEHQMSGLINPIWEDHRHT